MLWYKGQSIANQCHGSLSDVPVVKLTNPMQLVVQFIVRLCGCSESICLLSSLSLFSAFPLWDFLFICCGLDCSLLLSPVSLCAFCVCFLSLCECVHTSAHVVSGSAQTSIYLCVCVCGCVLPVHASLWDALISAHCGSAPSCPCCWPLIETNQACDGPIAVTPHPSHPRPNHLLIGPHRAPSRWHGRLI